MHREASDRRLKALKAGHDGVTGASAAAIDCNIGRDAPVLSIMDNNPHRKHPPDREPPTPSEAELLAALAESEAEAEAGLFVSGDEIMRELQESIARMEGRATAEHAGAEPDSPPRR
jgi:hypothetical protein